MKRILLILKTPPPVGGGELIHEALREYYSDKDAFVIEELCSEGRDKGSQGKFALWKAFEFARLWLRTAWKLVVLRPNLLFMGIGKGFPHFARDSILVWTARLLRVPVALELHGLTFYFLDEEGWRKRYGVCVASQVACIRVLGGSIVSNLRSHGISNTIVLDNAVDTPAWAGHAPAPEEVTFNILFVGTLSPEKGFDILVDASDRLHRTVDEFQVHCLGQWSSLDFEAEMLERIRALGLNDHFVLHGLQHSEKKWEVFSKCHLLTLPSRVEGQPLVILEALSFGMGIVATATGAIPDTIKHNQNGVLIEKGDSLALFEALDRLRSSSLRAQFRRENLKLFADRFTLNLFLRRHQRWLEECADGRLEARGQFFS